LTITQSNNKTFGGTITDTFSEYDGSGSGTTGPLNLLKNGPATLILSGANTYTGSTTVSAGSLQIDGSLSSSAVTVQSGGRLTGVGVLGGTVSVQFGGTVAPGDGAPGALTINSTLTLAGSAVMEVGKSGSTLTSDQIVGLTTVVYGGSLVVTNVGI